MYHYIRDLDNSKYPEIKGLRVTEFDKQLRYIENNYNLVRMKDVIAATRNESDLPEKACLLTFDDGYIDHYLTVFPMLHKRGIGGCFFPSSEVVERKKILDVNKIHFILAGIASKDFILEFINHNISKNKDNYDLLSLDEYLRKYAISNRFDVKEVAYIKTMLQYVLPSKLRDQIICDLFKKYITVDEVGFSDELYVNSIQLKEMHDNGMFIGNHGAGHKWMNTLDRLEQEKEIDEGLKFLRRIGGSTQDWVMAFPYGVWDNQLLEVLKQKGCAIGLTTEVGVASLNKANPLLLPRLDTNDFPKK